jgi:hypothetical protein
MDSEYFYNHYNQEILSEDASDSYFDFSTFVSCTFFAPKVPKTFSRKADTDIQPTLFISNPVIKN